MNGIIYKAQSPSGKIYIGQTRSDISASAQALLLRRISKHRCSANYGSKLPFHCALRKYGIGLMKWEILHEASNRETLNRLESFEITAHDCYVGRGGYNATAGGDLRTMSQATKDQMKTSAIQRWANPIKRAQGLEAMAAGKIVHKKRLARQYSEIARSILNRPDIVLKRAKRLGGGRPFVIIDRFLNEIVGRYVIINYAARSLGIHSRNSIQNCLHGRTLTFGRKRYAAQYI